MFKFIKTSYSKVKGAFGKTSSLFQHKIQELFKGSIHEGTIDELERLLYEADLGVATTSLLIAKVKSELQANKGLDSTKITAILKEELTCELKKYSSDMEEATNNGPVVVLVVGVNGSGKTTSVAKLAHHYQLAGKKVLIAAGDTFRAAAVQQLELWAQRLHIDIVKSAPKSDPSAVVFDAITAGIARSCDVVIIDTAGRLHVKTDLMQELQKIRRVCTKVLPESPHETLLVLDASIGQNALDQARTFHKYTPITGIILTKLDGTPKGGIVIAIQKELGIPVKMIGIGEGLEDLQPFNAEEFVSALFG
ncbi:MAG: signal recognition particle-docking protein FtsY [Chlamydiales bacterium]|nr:signal recognition particle-docking protein FtsY [Chlamydiales bacterium]